jgi:FkbH-like protein
MRQMTIESLQAWREPIVAEWRGEAAGLANNLKNAGGDLEFASRRLRRLASMRLGEAERLHLRRLVKTARNLPEPPPGFRPFRLLLVSNRTLSFLAADLEAAGAARGLLIEAVETEYDSAHALALNPAIEAPSGRFDAVMLLMDSDFFPVDYGLLDSASEAKAIESARRQVRELVAGLRVKSNAPVIAATIALPPDFQLSSADPAIAGTTIRCIQAINETIVESAAAGRAVVFDLAALAARVGTMAFFDPVRFYQAKVPFSFEASPVVADALAALIAAMTGRSGRALVLDLDNTLWGGVVADDGLEGIVLGQGSAEGEAFLAVQRHVLELRRRGVVLAVCSKSLEHIAREPFRSHPDMLLREEHISSFIANFDDKATNVARIARQLGLDPSVLVFLDDNPAERERVRSTLPFVMVPEIGGDPAHFVRALATSGYFEHLALTADDTQRAAAYHARVHAEALRVEIGDYDTYLRSLDMELTISSFDAVGRARITQLIQKSNQFNLTTKRYSEAEIVSIENDQTRLGWQVRLKDRFADHGMISVVIVEKGADSWSIDNWVMSCRVLERGIEEAIIQALAFNAVRNGVGELVGEYRPTARNAMVGELYTRLRFKGCPVSEGETTTYRLDLSRASFGPLPMRVITNSV